MKLFKKSIALISAFCLGLFAIVGLTSCEEKINVGQEALTKLSLLLDETLENSKADETNPGLGANLDLPYAINVEGVDYVVTYTTDNENATVSVDTEALTAEIVIKQTGDTQTFNLTATVEGESKSWEFQISYKDTSMVKTQAEVDAMANLMTYAQWAAAKSGDESVIQGYITHAHDYSASYANASVWLQDDNGGYYGYRVKVASEADYNEYFKVGNKIAIVGKVSPYNGWQEMASGCTYYYISDATPKTYDFKDVTTLWSENTPSSAASCAVQNQLIKATGKIVSVPDYNSSEMTITISVGGQNYSIYYKKAYTEIPKSLVTDLKVGYTVEFTGAGSISKNGVQICPISPESYTVKSTEVTAQDKVNGAVAEVKNQAVSTSYYDSLDAAVELITKTTDGCTVAYELTDVTGTGIVLNGNKLSVAVDGKNASKAKLTATISLEGAESKTYVWNIKTLTDEDVAKEILASIEDQEGLTLEYDEELVGARQRLFVPVSPSTKALTYEYTLAENDGFVKLGQYKTSQQYYFDILKISETEITELKLTCTFVYGKTDTEAGITKSVDFTIKLKHSTIVEAATPIKDALKLDDGATVLVEGKVVEINTAWSDSYGNISVTINDGTGSLYLYRLATNVAVGDYIQVKGTMATYKGARQMAQGATATILGKKVNTLEAAALEDGTAVVMEGTVSKINTEWSEQYGNITVTIADEAGTFYLYRISTKVELGDYIVVKGVIGSYKGSKQLAQGGTATVIAKKVSTTEAAALEDGVKVVLEGTISKINTEWSDQYGNITVTIADEAGTFYLYRITTKVEVGQVVRVFGVIGSYKGSKQLAQGGYAVVLEEASTDDTPEEVVPEGTIALTTLAAEEYKPAELENIATKVTDSKLLNVVVSKGGCQTVPVLRQDGIRIHRESSSTTENGNGGYLLIQTVSGYIIKSVTVAADSDLVFTVFAGETAVTGTDGVYTINGGVLKIQNTGGVNSDLTKIWLVLEEKADHVAPALPEAPAPVVKEFTLTNFFAAEKGVEFGSVTGVVVGTFTAKNLILLAIVENGTYAGGVYVFTPYGADLSSIEVGKTITIAKGTKDIYNGLHEYKVAALDDITVGAAATVPTAVNLTTVITASTDLAKDLEKYQGMLVTVTGTYTADGLKVGENTLAYYKDSKILADATTVEMVEGSTYTVTGFLNWYKKPQITPISANAIVVAE